MCRHDWAVFRRGDWALMWKWTLGCRAARSRGSWGSSLGLSSSGETGLELMGRGWTCCAASKELSHFCWEFVWIQMVAFCLEVDGSSVRFRLISKAAWAIRVRGNRVGALWRRCRCILRLACAGTSYLVQTSVYALCCLLAVLCLAPCPTSRNSSNAQVARPSLTWYPVPTIDCNSSVLRADLWLRHELYLHCCHNYKIKNNFLCSDLSLLVILPL